MITNHFSTPMIVPSWLARKKPPLQVVDSEALSGPSRIHGEGQSILVIDDETAIADSLAEILSDHGYDALAFYNGRAAIESVRERCPDLVICDVIMPALNGVQTALAIRELCPHTRILLFSGQAGTVDLLQEARERGHWFELLPKPIHPEDLLRRLAMKRN